MARHLTLARLLKAAGVAAAAALTALSMHFAYARIVDPLLSGGFAAPPSPEPPLALDVLTTEPDAPLPGNGSRQQTALHARQGSAGRSRAAAAADRRQPAGAAATAAAGLRRQRHRHLRGDTPGSAPHGSGERPVAVARSR